MKKSVVYTRSSEALLNLAETDPEGSTDIPLQAYKGRRVAIKHLLSVRTKDYLDAYVDDFSSAYLPIFIPL